MNQNYATDIYNCAIITHMMLNIIIIKVVETVFVVGGHGAPPDKHS